MSKLITILITALIIFIIIKTVKIVRIILTLVVGAIYMPLNNFNSAVQRWYFKMKHQDKVIYYAFTPIYWLLVGITFVISVPYEFLIAMDIH